MDDAKKLKLQLPHPYNQDLSHVVRRLNRRLPFSRERLANDPVTAGYMCAAMRLVQQHLGPGAERTPIDPDDENSLSRPLLGFLSQRAIVEEMARNPHPFPRRGSVSTMRSTWASHSDFIADLLNFGLWSEHYPASNSDQIAATAERLLEGPDFVEAVRLLSVWELSMLFNMSTLRLSLVAAAAAEGDDTIREAGTEHYQGILGPWKLIYGEVLRHRGLQLRPGLTVETMADLFAALADGLVVRKLIDPTHSVPGSEGESALMATGVIALMLGCLEPKGENSLLPLEEALHQLVYGHESTSGSA